MSNLIQNFNNYIEEKASNYAIMLNGSWGSGKSYFIENKWLPNVDLEKYEVKMVSLNGLTSIDELLSQIGNNDSDLEKLDGNKKINIKVDDRVKYFFNSVVKTIGDNYNVNFSVSEYRKLSGEKWLEHKDEKIKILIIDDLERTKIDIEELFGLVLQYISKQNLKVVIICNESELNTINDTRYNKIKEKLIGDTFNIEVDKEEVLNSFLQVIEVKDIYKTAIESVFVDVLENNKYTNLRVIYRSFLKFAHILKSVDNVITDNNYKKEVIVKYVKELFSIFFYLYYQKETGLIEETHLSFVDNFYHFGDFIHIEDKKEIEEKVDVRGLAGNFKQKFVPFRKNNFYFYKSFLFQGNCDICKYEPEIKEDLDYINLEIEQEKENNKDCLYRLMIEFLDCDFDTFKRYQREFYEELKRKTECSINYLFMGYVYFIYFYEKGILHIDELKTLEDIDTLFTNIANKVKLEVIEKYLYFRSEWSVFSLGYRGHSFDFDSLKYKKELGNFIIKLRNAYFNKVDKSKKENFIKILKNYDNTDSYYLNKLDGLNRCNSIEITQNEIFWDIDILNSVGYKGLANLILDKPLKGQHNFWYVVKSYYPRNGNIEILKKELKVLKKFEVEYKNRLDSAKKIGSNASLYLEWIYREISKLIEYIEKLK